MTRPSALVLDGNEVKFRLIAERTATRTPVHVDWVRFTVLRHNITAPGLGDLTPTFTDASLYEAWQEFSAALAQVPDCDHSSAGQALELARKVADAMGPDFVAHPEPRKGHDFYRHRISIERNGVEVGWVGFQASSDSPRQAAQARTIHANLYGAACTFAALGWTERIAALVEDHKAELTRVDLALDLFDGLAGGMPRVLADYEAGLMDVYGKRPKANMVGDWTGGSKGARSFYVGSKENGKQTNAYEKGDQLFGVEEGSKWLRIEARLGNKVRVLEADMLRRPADYFAGLSDWHAAVLAEADAQLEVAPEPIPCTPKLPVMTVAAECARVKRWFANTAAPTFLALLKFAPEGGLYDLAGNAKLPGRLSRFSLAEVARGFADVFTADGTGPALGAAF